MAQFSGFIFHHGCDVSRTVGERWHLDLDRRKARELARYITSRRN